MKIKINIDGCFLGYEKKFTTMVNWDYPVLPRVKEGIFIDHLIKDLPAELEGWHLWNIWSIDWEVSKINGICPQLWIEHIESAS